MASKIYYSPFLPVFNGNGLPLGAARLYFYYTGTTTPAPVYADANMATPLANPVVANSAGQHPNIYLDDAITYRVRATDRFGTQLGDDFDPYTPGQAATVVPDLPEFASPDGASLVGYDSERTVRERLDLEVYVTDTRFAGGAQNSLAFDSTAAFQAAVDSGAHRILVPRGQYLLNGTVTIRGNGITIEGEGDYDAFLWAGGSGPLFRIGEGAAVIPQHNTLKNFTLGARPSFTGKMLVRIERAFQTYLLRLRYNGSLKDPTQAIYLLDNDHGTSEQPVRTIFRDCYIDGANYTTGLTNAPIGIWNTGGIQTMVDNCHIQDCEIGIKLGVNPAVDTEYYDPSLPNEGDFADFYMVNNSRYQVGDRGGTTTNARGLDIWRGVNVHVSDCQFYLNNNGPDPALSGQRVARFNDPDFDNFTFLQNSVNANARADYPFEVMPGGRVSGTLDDSAFSSLPAGKNLVKVGAGGTSQLVVGPGNRWDNINNYGPSDQRTDAPVAPYDLGAANNHYYISATGAKTITNFVNGRVGVLYVLQFEITGGSVNLTSINGAGSSGLGNGIVLDGHPGGTITLRTGDILHVWRAPIAAVERYRAKLIRGSGLAAGYVQITTGGYPADATVGAISWNADKLVINTASGWKNVAVEP